MLVLSGAWPLMNREEIMNAALSLWCNLHCREAGLWQSLPSFDTLEDPVKVRSASKHHKRGPKTSSPFGTNKLDTAPSNSLNLLFEFPAGEAPASLCRLPDNNVRNSTSCNVH